MIIAIDTRQQDGKHRLKLKHFEENGIKTVRTKLYIGDYALLNNQAICIDTKKDLVEVAGNLCGKQHERFRAECVRAKECGIKLIVLIEEPITLEKVCDWVSPTRKNGTKLTNVKGEVLAKVMQTMTVKYGVVWQFCKPQNAGAEIIKILGGQNEN